MKYLALACFAFLAGCASTPATDTTPITPPQSTTAAQAPDKAAAKTEKMPVGVWYQQSLEVLKQKGDKAKAADFQRVREMYADSPGYSPYIDPVSDLVKSGLEQMNGGDWAGCAKSAAEIVEASYTSLSGHFMGMVCNKKSGNQQASEKYKFTLDGFMEAIWSTGDGKTMETAFHTYSTQELRAFLQLQGLEIVDQALVNGNQGVYDVIGVKDPETGKEFKLYFNITKQWIKGMAAFK